MAADQRGAEEHVRTRPFGVRETPRGLAVFRDSAPIRAYWSKGQLVPKGDGSLESGRERRPESGSRIDSGAGLAAAIWDYADQYLQVTVGSGGP